MLTRLSAFLAGTAGILAPLFPQPSLLAAHLGLAVLVLALALVFVTALAKLIWTE